MRPKFTQQKFEELQKELAKLQVNRKAAVIDLKKARDMGDLSENGYYKSARLKLSEIDRRLRELKYFTTKGAIIKKPISGIVQLGSTVILENNGKTKTYIIVGSYEANPKEGKISDESPLGKILLGKKIGDSGELMNFRYTIKGVS